MANYLLVAGTSQIAHAVANRLLEQNHQIFITGRDEEKTKVIAAKLEAPYFILDASNFSEMDKAFAKASELFGELNGAVSFAGSLFLKPAHATTEQEFAHAISSNLTTAFATVRAVGKYMAESGGSVVLMSSAAAKVGLANHEAIAAAKAGIIGLVLSAAATYANNHLRFNAVAPGLVDTSLTKSLTSSDITRKISESMHPLNRLGTVQDIASAILFLLNLENDWITGQVLAVDGGLSNVRPKLKA